TAARASEDAQAETMRGPGSTTRPRSCNTVALVEPDTGGPPAAKHDWGRGKAGLIAALVTVVTATALAVVVDRSGSVGARTATVAAVRQVVVAPPATTPPVTQ